MGFRDSGRQRDLACDSRELTKSSRRELTKRLIPVADPSDHAADVRPEKMIHPDIERALVRLNNLSLRDSLNPVLQD